MKFVVRDALSTGKTNAVPGKELARALGYKSVRALQEQIAAERIAGAVILSDPNGGGYYLSDDPSELAVFTRRMDSLARNTARAAQSAHRALDAATGQETMDGWYCDG